ncbi:TonB-dependent receptor [Pinibacter soli]|uniref:TonB-dependent receptor n=1 Tax=Pinibacter soli TaxID=3044211 RepID=A0ABT6RCE9_9BACT|nr:TonB-dependent receptor [Pinibacter soli]MDI3320254.1 TonB-dependent receptor [Pinibacter soli]
MNKTFITLTFLLLSAFSFAQTTLSGVIKDYKGKPIPGASITLRDTYDGATSDSSGHYNFSTPEKGEKILAVTCVGYKAWEQTINLHAGQMPVNIMLKENLDELKAVVVTAGSFEASDSKRTTVLNSIDIVTTASANADVTAAIRTLPGTQQVGEKEGLFVRGGSGEEAKIFIDGTLVNNFFFSSVPDIAQRGRFNPFLFKGTVFTSGGYSALYGQALSAALILETVDLPERTSANFGLSTVGLNAGYQKLAKNNKASWGINYNYTNLLPYFAVVPQKPDYFRVPLYHNAEGNFRIKTSRTGMLKFYGYFNYNQLGLRNQDIDSSTLKNAFGLFNNNEYANLSYKEVLGRGWKFNIGTSYSHNLDNVNTDLQNQDNENQHIPYYPYLQKAFKVDSRSQLATVKTVLEKHLSGISAVRFGGEYLWNKENTDYSNDTIKHALSSYIDNFTALFAETDIYITNDLAAKLGTRYEHSSYLNKSNIVPRASMAYKIGNKGQVSFAYGMFYQKPERNYLLFNNNFLYQKATHYILNYQKLTSEHTFRVEAYYKKYNDLLKTVPDTNNLGYGYAQGIEVFWRDKKSLKNFDYWLSYSYLDTKRDYLNYPKSMTPNFAATHTASAVVKKFVLNWKTQFNASYTFATGRPYYNLMADGAGKYYIADQGKTVTYNNLSFSVNYLPRLGKKDSKTFIVWVLSATNVLGNKLVYNYNYSANGMNKVAVTPPAGRFYFLGCFISFGIDRTEDVINNNL